MFEAMADYEASFPLQESYLWPKLRTSEILEDTGLRHCVVGETVAKVLGSDPYVIDLFLAVADERLEEAYSILLQHKFIDIGLKTNHILIQMPQKTPVVGQVMDS